MKMKPAKKASPRKSKKMTPREVFDKNGKKKSGK